MQAFCRAVLWSLALFGAFWIVIGFAFIGLMADAARIDWKRHRELRRKLMAKHPAADAHHDAAKKHEDAMKSHRQAAASHEAGQHEQGQEHAESASMHSDQAKQGSDQAKTKSQET